MRLIDADTLKEKCFGKRGGLIHTSDVDNMPTIEIIRCEDCKFGKWDIGDRGMYCGRRYVELGTYEDFFCAAAERREVNE